MSREYPCVHFDGGKCKLSRDESFSFCVYGPCKDETPSNADRIRSMTDEELNELFHEIYNAGAEDAVAYEWGQRTNSFEWTMEWLKQPAEGE